MENSSNNQIYFPRISLAGLKGGSGKTIVSLALCRLFVQRGLRVKPFKKGPDYIDAKWLTAAAGTSASNLDPFLFPVHKVKSLFWSFAADHDIAIIEGNRGLFDGKDVSGSYSTAELSRILNSPVILVMDCTKVTRTAAAIVLGCRHFEEDLDLAGVILNRTAGQRHRTIIRQSIEKYTDVPVIGALPRMEENPIPERHMGLISLQEHEDGNEVFTRIGKYVEQNVDVDAIVDIARKAPARKDSPIPALSLEPIAPDNTLVIGIVRDKAFWFYYQENLEALEEQGARLVELSLLKNEPWPEVHGLYLGGGFPETMAGSLDENVLLKKKLRALTDSGLPIFAECGGLMYLGESLEYEGQSYSMTGILPVKTKLYNKPQGHGYVKARVIRKNPFFPVGAEISGHEFHYSQCVPVPQGLDFCFSMKRGTGITKGFDGLSVRNVLAGYTHIHALGAEGWAENFVRAARIYRDCLAGSTGPCPDIVCK